MNEMRIVVASTLLPVMTVVLMAAAGCGSGRGRVEDSQASLDEATKAMEAGDFTAAEEALSSAIEKGGLGPDRYGDALALRAVCRGHLGQFETAHADLDMAEQIAPNLDVVLAARSFVFSKEGKTRDAQDAMKKARKINRDVKPFDT